MADDSESSALAELPEVAAILLARPTLVELDARRHQPVLLGDLRALRLALRSLLVERPRHLGRPAPLAGAGHAQHVALRADGHLQLVARADELRRLGARAVDVDLPAVDGLG